MRLYSKFRPFLFAVALGLASVWFYKGMMLAKDYVHVDLPQTLSGDVLYIYRKDERFMPIGGGSHCCQPNISTSESGKPIRGRLSFVIHDQSIYEHRAGFRNRREFINIRIRHDGSYEIAPYLIECLDNRWTAPKQFTSKIIAASEFHTIELNRDIAFTVERPAIKGECQLYVGTADSAEKAQVLLFESQTIGSQITDESIDRLFGRWQRFINE